MVKKKHLTKKNTLCWTFYSENITGGESFWHLSDVGRFCQILIMKKNWNSSNKAIEHIYELKTAFACTTPMKYAFICTTPPLPAENRLCPHNAAENRLCLHNPAEMCLYPHNPAYTHRCLLKTTFTRTTLLKYAFICTTPPLPIQAQLKTTFACIMQLKTAFARTTQLKCTFIHLYHRSPLKTTFTRTIPLNTASPRWKMPLHVQPRWNVPLDAQPRLYLHKSTGNRTGTQNTAFARTRLLKCTFAHTNPTFTCTSPQNTAKSHSCRERQIKAGLYPVMGPLRHALCLFSYFLIYITMTETAFQMKKRKSH